MTLVLLMVIAPTMAGPLSCIAAGTLVGIEGVTRITVAAEMLLHQNHDAWPTTM